MVRFEGELRKEAVLQRFGSSLVGLEEEPWSLSLFDFVNTRPFKYFDDDLVQSVLDFYEKNSTQAVAAIESLDRELTHAVHALVTPGPSWDAEHLPSLSSPSDYAELEQVWFPEYQRYAEHAFNHLINCPLSVFAQLRSRQYCGQTLTNRAESLGKLGFRPLVEGFRGAVRNAISHGNTEFAVAAIRFVDRKATEELTPGEFLHLFDELVAACHALTLGLLLFIARNTSLFSGRSIPLGATLLALRGAGSYGRLTVERLIPMEVLGGRQQLAVICSAPMPSQTMQTFEALYLAARAQDFGATSFERIALTFDTGHATSGSIFLDASKLAKLRRDGGPAEALGEVVETSMLWHDSSNLARRIHVAGMSLRIGLAQAGLEVRRRWAESGVTPLRLRYSIRHVQNKSAEALRRVEAIAVLRFGEDPSGEDLYRIARQVVRRLRRRPIASAGLKGTGSIRRRPRYVWVKLFKQDAVLRNLENPGPDNPNLVLRAEWVARRNRKQPVFVRFPTAVEGGYRFEYPVRTLKENLDLAKGSR